LHLDKIRHLRDFVDTPEGFAHALTAGEGSYGGNRHGQTSFASGVTRSNSRPVVVYISKNPGSLAPPPWERQNPLSPMAQPQKNSAVVAIGQNGRFEWPVTAAKQ